MRRKDPQAQRVYRAEFSIGRGAQLHAADQVRRYVASITGSGWWAEHGWPPVKVHCGRGGAAWGGRVSSGAFYVSLPGWPSPDLEHEAVTQTLARRPVVWPWAWRELTIVHELAHVSRLSEVGILDHGSAWCGRYLEVTEAVVGPLAAWKLARAFDRNAVAYASAPECVVEPLGPDALRATAWTPYRAVKGPQGARGVVLQESLL